MIHALWRVAIAAFCFAAFFYITPLFLNVLGVNPGSDIMQLVKGLAVCLAIAYVIWGPHKYPWGAPG